jgi:hypothetical protein
MWVVFFAICIAYAAICLLGIIIGFGSVIVLWPFQKLAILFRRAAHYRRSA